MQIAVPPPVRHVTVRHPGGSTKRLAVEGLTPDRAYVHWPLAGQYDLLLPSGQLVRQTDRRLLPWWATPRDRARLLRAAPRP